VVEWLAGDVRANGIQTHFARSGGQKPALVLLHGATDSGMCWEPVARRLADDFDVVLPDARGHGGSTAPPEGYTSTERAADVAALITELGLGRAAIGGHSMGAVTALRLSVDYPELVSCAFLEDPPLRPFGFDSSKYADRMRSDVAVMRQASRDELIATAKLFHPTWSDNELPHWADAKLRVSEPFMQSLGRGAEPAWQELVPRLARPTLLVMADEERGGMLSAECAEEARQLNPGFIEVARVTRAGHNIRRDRFEPFLDAVSAFLAREFART
jgi:pimeloyl-ACP methyl ester carboxylesterase